MKAVTSFLVFFPSIITGVFSRRKSAQRIVQIFFAELFWIPFVKLTLNSLSAKTFPNITGPLSLLRIFQTKIPAHHQPSASLSPNLQICLVQVPATRRAPPSHLNKGKGRDLEMYFSDGKPRKTTFKRALTKQNYEQNLFCFTPLLPSKP